MPTTDPTEAALRILDALTRELEAADNAARVAECASSNPDADTAAGHARGYADGLRRAVELLEGLPVA